VLPFIRWADKNSKSLSLTEPLKIVQYTDFNLIAKDVIKGILKFLDNYECGLITDHFNHIDFNFYLVSRPWRQFDNISIESSCLKDEFENQLEIELSSLLNKKNNYKKNKYPNRTCSLNRSYYFLLDLTKIIYYANK